jgi:hypothetical protein
MVEAYSHRRITPVLQSISQQRTIFKEYFLERVKFRSSMFFIKLCNVPAHKGKYVHFHAKFTMAQDGVLLLTSTPDPYILAEKTKSTYWKQGIGREPEWTFLTREMSLEQLENRTTFVQAVSLSLFILSYFELKVNFAVSFSILC